MFRSTTILLTFTRLDSSPVHPIHQSSSSNQSLKPHPPVTAKQTNILIQCSIQSLILIQCSNQSLFLIQCSNQSFILIQYSKQSFILIWCSNRSIILIALLIADQSLTMIHCSLIDSGGSHYGSPQQLINQSSFSGVPISHSPYPGLLTLIQLSVTTNHG